MTSQTLIMLLLLLISGSISDYWYSIENPILTKNAPLENVTKNSAGPSPPHLEKIQMTAFFSGNRPLGVGHPQSNFQALPCIAQLVTLPHLDIDLLGCIYIWYNINYTYLVFLVLN